MALAHTMTPVQRARESLGMPSGPNPRIGHAWRKLAATRLAKTSRMQLWDTRDPNIIHGRLQYGKTISMATLNCNGLNVSGKRAQIADWANENALMLVCLQETKVPHNAIEKHGKYTFYFSTSVNHKDLALKSQLQANNKKLGHELRLKCTELQGVGLMIHDKIKPCLLQIQPLDNIIMVAELEGPPNMFVINAYAPQSGSLEEVKDEFYKKL